MFCCVYFHWKTNMLNGKKENRIFHRQGILTQCFPNLQHCEASLILLLPFQLCLSSFSRQEAQALAHLRGEDGKLIVRYYSDTHNKMQQRRHQRSSTFPLPKIFSKLPPSLSPSTHAPSAQEEFFFGEGLRLFLIVLPDSSGFCKWVYKYLCRKYCTVAEGTRLRSIPFVLHTLCSYYSGHTAISFCRKGDGSRGLYTIVYDDTDAGKMIGCFLPSGRGCCYYRNGSIRNVMDKHGGKLLDKVGLVVPNSDICPMFLLV